MEEMRKQFEQWCRDNSISRDRDFDGDGYFFPKANLAWSAWKASREMLVVELPTQEKYDDPLSAYNAISDCKDAIQAAGITVKGEGDGR